MWFQALAGLTTVKGKSVRKQVTKNDWKGQDADISFWSHFGQNSIKNVIENSWKKDAEKHMKLTPKGYQNGVEIDAKTHQKQW